MTRVVVASAIQQRPTAAFTVMVIVAAVLVAAGAATAIGLRITRARDSHSTLDGADATAGGWAELTAQPAGAPRPQLARDSAETDGDPTAEWLSRPPAAHPALGAPGTAGGLLRRPAP